MDMPKAYDDKDKLTFEYILHRVKTATTLDEMLYWWQIGIDHPATNVKPR